MVKRKPRVRCEACAGTGKRHLTSVESETLEAVGQFWKPTARIAERVFEISGYHIKGPALCNRLVDLEALGLIERRPTSGKSFEWRQAT